MRKMTKEQVLREFRELWQWAIKGDPQLLGDSIAKREAFNNYVDRLNKEKRITDQQAFSWSNPF